jgi:hypothetical protein
MAKRKIIVDSRQQDFQFDTEVNIIPLSERQFTIEYLKSLDSYNEFLKSSVKPEFRARYERRLVEDNLLLRDMFAGIKNSYNIPIEIFDGLNALEIAILETGIYGRKFLYTEEMLKENGAFQLPVLIRRKIELEDCSRIKAEGHMDGKSLYQIMDYLTDATRVQKMNRHYKSEWIVTQEALSVDYQQKRYVKMNPYDPSTLKERCDAIEKQHPMAVKKFTEALSKPFIPEKIRVLHKHGNTIVVKNPSGFETPGKTYKRGVKGVSFYRLDEYAENVRDYFVSKIAYRISPK